MFAGLSKEGMVVELVDDLPWDDVEEVARRIAAFDIGLMPLVDDETSRGKCAFKAIEYMACGVATVCSRVGENGYLIEDGVNGFLASGPEEWVARLEALFLDPSLRARLSRAGQETVRTGYSLEVNALRVVALARGGGRTAGRPPRDRRRATATGTTRTPPGPFRLSSSGRRAARSS